VFFNDCWKFAVVVDISIHIPLYNLHRLVVSVLFLSLEKIRSFRSWVLSLAMLSFQVVGGSISMLITSVVW